MRNEKRSEELRKERRKEKMKKEDMTKKKHMNIEREKNER